MAYPRFVRNRFAVAALSAALAAPVGAVIAVGQTQDSPDAAIPVATPASASPTMALPDFAALARQYGPAVVNITVEANVKTAAPGSVPMLPDNHPFAPFFRSLPQQQQPRYGQGSGFIVSNDGIILTNAHVVDGAETVTVTLTDRREFEAEVIGVDAASDTAVLRIQAENLPTVRIGDPSRVSVGEWVVAIGAPFGFENSVTQGIVSAKGRVLPDGSYVPFLQTDVAINPGNSGGPLFNLNGEVIGINSQIYSRSGGYQGISFAIPIDVAMNVSDQLQETGHVSRGRIGVVIQPLDGALAKNFGLDKPEGALVSQVEDGSPAEDAGLQSGDVILRFNGEPLTHSSALPAKVAALKPGQEVTLEIWRDGKRRDIDIELGEMATEQVASAEAATQQSLGLAVRPLTPSEQREADTEGLLVEDVAGSAARAGIRPGDIVVSANGTRLDDVDDLRAKVDAADGPMALLIQRNGRRLFVPVEIG